MTHYSEKRQGLFWGGMLILLGLLLLFDQWNIIDFSDMWPLIIIAVGVWHIIKPRQSDNNNKNHLVGDQQVLTDEQNIHYSKTLGDLNLQIHSQNFTGGSARTIFGDIKVDLSSVHPAEGENVLDLSTTFGDIKITISPSLPLKIISSNTAGDMDVFEEKRSGMRQSVTYQSPDYENAESRLKIITSQVFGDLKVW